MDNYVISGSSEPHWFDQVNYQSPRHFKNQTSITNTSVKVELPDQENLDYIDTHRGRKMSQ